jgi:hypothetical protein
LLEKNTTPITIPHRNHRRTQSDLYQIEELVDSPPYHPALSPRSIDDSLMAHPQQNVPFTKTPLELLRDEFHSKLEMVHGDMLEQFNLQQEMFSERLEDLKIQNQKLLDELSALRGAIEFQTARQTS